METSRYPNVSFDPELQPQVTVHDLVPGEVVLVKYESMAKEVWELGEFQGTDPEWKAFMLFYGDMDFLWHSQVLGIVRVAITPHTP